MVLLILTGYPCFHYYLSVTLMRLIRVCVSRPMIYFVLECCEKSDVYIFDYHELRSLTFPVFELCSGTMNPFKDLNICSSPSSVPAGTEWQCWNLDISSYPCTDWIKCLQSYCSDDTECMVISVCLRVSLW